MPTAGLTNVVVVSHRSASTLGDCLDAVLASTVPVEVVVVDNGSDDGSTELVAAMAATDARLRLIANAGNPGFASACNQGAAAAGGDGLLFLNPDAFVAPDTVARLRARLAGDPAIGLLGCTVVDAHGRAHGPQRRREPTWRRSLMSLAGLDRWQDRWPKLEGLEQAPPTAGAGSQAVVAVVDADAVETVDAVNGAVMLLPTDLFHGLGGFDTGFRLHAEDVDLCRRVRDAGRRVALAVDVPVVHVGGVSGRRRPLWVEWQKTRSLWRYFRKHQPGTAWPIRFAVALGLGLRLLLKAPLLLLRPRR